MYPGKWGVEVPDKLVAVHAATGEALTHSQLNEHSNRLAQLLWARGLRRGDHIAIFMEDDLRYFEVTWAALRSGLYLTTVNRHLTGRATFMIISGVNIYPQETEDALIMHPKVADVAVVGVPNEEMGEEVKAVVQPVADTPADDELAEELLAYAREHLAHYKCPRSIDFMEQLPRLPTGKLYKRLLKDRYWGREGSRIV